MALTGVILTIGLALLSAWLLHWFNPKRGLPEPPRIAPKIPLLGHIIGVAGQGMSYITNLSMQHNLPAITLDFLLLKAYIITSPALIKEIQKHRDLITHHPFRVAAANRLAGVGSADLQFFRLGVQERISKAINDALLKEGLDEVNAKMLPYMKAAVDELSSQAGTPVDLWLWCRRTMTRASTNAVYGPLNPYNDPEIEDAFCEFEGNVSSLLVGIWPRVTARRSWKARARLAAAFTRYFQAQGQLDSSRLIRGLWQEHHGAGARLETISQLEASHGIPILSNTAPSAFWTIFDLCSRPGLLAQVRAELQQNAVRVDPSSGVHVVDLADLRERCPLLLAAFQETLRLRSSSVAIRVVGQEDVNLDDRYSLKAGSAVLIPAAVLNRQQSVWGGSVEEYDPSRFLTPGGVKASGFLSFGVSPRICPGRHVATGEILALTALLILRFDVTPCGGDWGSPRINRRAVTSSMPQPQEGFKVTLAKRGEYEGVEWELRLTEGRGRFALVV